MARAYQPEAWARAIGVSLGLRALSQVLSSYAESESGDQDVWPSPQTLAELLGVTPRYIQDFSKEGELRGWWTKITERKYTGGSSVTWRLHFPVIAPTRTRAEPKANNSSSWDNHSTKAEANPNGTRTEPERNPNGTMVPPDIEGMKGGRYEGTKDLFGDTSPLPAKKEESQAKTKAPRENRNDSPTDQGVTGDGAQGVEKPQLPMWQQLIAEYNLRCTTLSKCEGRAESVAAKKAAIALRRDPLAKWIERFDKVDASDVLNGRIGSGWKADFLWIIGPENAEKIDADRYLNRQAPAKVAQSPKHFEWPDLPDHSKKPEQETEQHEY